MIGHLERIVSIWIARYARPEPAAVDAARARSAAVVVTGGSEGIGRTIAERFAALGRTIVLVARNESRLDRASREIGERHAVRVYVMSLDLTRADAPGELQSFLNANGLYCDILVNNAGIGLGGRFIDHDSQALDKLITLNVTAATRLMRHMLPEMLLRAQGGVLNVASLGGYVPGPHQAAYYASKSYLISLSEAVAEEVKGRGVRIAVSVPGPVETRFHARMGAQDALYRRLVPAASAQRIAGAAVRGYRLGRRVIGPGFLTGFAPYALRVLPHRLTVPLVGVLLRKRGSGTGGSK